MRILMTALQPGGGIRTFFRYIYSQPCFSDCTFDLVAPDLKLSDYLETYLPENRIRLIVAERGNRRFVGQIRRLARTGEYDLVHSHGFSAGLLTEVARAGVGVPHLMTAHDVFLPAQFEGMKGRIKHFAMSRLFRRMTGIHTVTDDARENLLEFFPAIDRQRVHGILHGVDTEYFRDGVARDLKNEIGLSPDTPLIGFFGRFMGQKGFRLLVDAIERIVDEKELAPLPHVVTFGWGGFIREDYQYLQEKGLGDYFHQMPQTDDMAAALKGVDVIAMPSRWEACGLLAMEALSAGVPIIGAGCVGLREVLSGSPAQITGVGSVDELEKALLFEVNETKARLDAFLAYQPEAIKRFHIQRPASELRSLYRLMVSGETDR